MQFLIPVQEQVLMRLKLSTVPSNQVSKAGNELSYRLMFMESTPTHGAPVWMDDRDEVWEKLMETQQNIQKTYTPKHGKLPYKILGILEKKYPYPDTGLEEVLLYIAAWEKLLDVKVPDKDVIRVALKENPPEQLYLPEWETRYYLPKEIEDLPETERASATLKLLQQIKSSNEFLKDLSPLPEQS